MNDKSISEMTNKELDTALAVAKWGVVINKDGRWELRDKRGNFITRSGMWHPSTDIAQAMVCLKDVLNARLEDQVVSYLIEKAVADIGHLVNAPLVGGCFRRPLPSDYLLWWLSHPSQPRLLCEAVLEATRREKEEQDAEVPDA